MGDWWPRRFACASALGASVLAPIAACSFPNVAFYDASADGVATNDGPGAEVGDDAQPGGEIGVSTNDGNSSDSASDGTMAIGDSGPVADSADGSAPPDTGSDRNAGSMMDSGGGPNCDCGADALTYKENFSCSGLVNCNGQGFMGTVACGQMGTLLNCGPGTVLGLGCTTSQVPMVTQRCQ